MRTSVASYEWGDNRYVTYRVETTLHPDDPRAETCVAHRRFTDFKQLHLRLQDPKPFPLRRRLTHPNGVLEHRRKALHAFLEAAIARYPPDAHPAALLDFLGIPPAALEEPPPPVAADAPTESAPREWCGGLAAALRCFAPPPPPPPPPTPSHSPESAHDLLADSPDQTAARLPKCVAVWEASVAESERLRKGLVAAPPIAHTPAHQTALEELEAIWRRQARMPPALLPPHAVTSFEKLVGDDGKHEAVFGLDGTYERPLHIGGSEQMAIVYEPQVRIRFAAECVRVVSGIYARSSSSSSSRPGRRMRVEEMTASSRLGGPLKFKLRVPILGATVVPIPREFFNGAAAWDAVPAFRDSTISHG